MSPVTGLAHLARQLLPLVHMGNVSPVSKLRFQPGYCSHGKVWSVHMEKFLARLHRSQWETRWPSG